MMHDLISTGRYGVLFLLRFSLIPSSQGFNFPAKAAYPDEGACNCRHDAAYFAKGMYY